MLCLVGEFPVEKKKVSVIIAAFVTKSDDHKNKKQTNKQTNKTKRTTAHRAEMIACIRGKKTSRISCRNFETNGRS